MPKIPSLYVFELIKSLSPAEKRYFQVYSKKHVLRGSNKYIKLFNILKNQGAYNEVAIKNKLEIKKNYHLKDLKIYLYSLILRSLKEYHTGNSIDINLKNMLIEAELLNQKSLYKQAKEMIIKAKKIAFRFEKFTSLIELSVLEREVDKGIPLPASLKQTSKHIRERKMYIEKLENESAYLDILYELAQKRNIVGQDARSIKEVKQYAKIIENPLLSHIKKAKSIRAQNIFINIKSFYSSIESNYDKEHIYAQKRFELMIQNPFIFKNEPFRKLRITNNCIKAYIQLNQLNKAMSINSWFRKIETESANLEQYKMNSYYLNSILIHVKQNRFSELIRFSIEINQWLKETKKLKTFEDQYLLINYYYYTSYSYFALAKTDKAVQYINLLNDKRITSLTESDLGVIRIIELIYRYEANDFQMVEYLSKSIYRSLLRKDKLYKTEQLILEFIRNSFYFKSKVAMIKGLKLFNSKLESIAGDPFEKTLLQHFDFISWIKSKVYNKKFIDVLNEKKIDQIL